MRQSPEGFIIIGKKFPMIIKRQLHLDATAAWNFILSIKPGMDLIWSELILSFHLQNEYSGQLVWIGLN